MLIRCLRHKNDWEAIVLVDERFASRANTPEGQTRRKVKQFVSLTSRFSACKALLIVELIRIDMCHIQKFRSQVGCAINFASTTTTQTASLSLNAI